MCLVFQTCQTGHMVQVPAADATLRIIGFLAKQRGPIAAQSIATQLGIPRSSIYQLLAVLCSYGFVVHFPEEKRYGLGTAAFELSSAYSRQQPLTRLAAPLMAKLVDDLGESAHVAVLQGTDVLYLIEERAKNRPSLVSDVGVRLPAHLTASGRALLSALPPAQLRALYNSANFAGPFSPDAELGPRSYRELRDILVRVRQDGFATENSEITRGFASVGVVVKDHLGWPAAALAVTYAAPRSNEEIHSSAKIATIVPALTAAARELSRRIYGTK